MTVLIDLEPCRLTVCEVKALQGKEIVDPKHDGVCSKMCVFFFFVLFSSIYNGSIIIVCLYAASRFGQQVRIDSNLPPHYFTINHLFGNEEGVVSSELSRCYTASSLHIKPGGWLIA